MTFKPRPQNAPKRAPGKHYGPLPASPEIQASITASNDAGFNTVLASFYDTLPAEVGPDQLHALSELA